MLEMQDPTAPPDDPTAKERTMSPATAKKSNHPLSR
jgi:hypothetical protein